MKKFFSFIFTMAVGFYNAFLASLIWGWFLVPMGAVPITTLQMCGLLLLVHLSQMSTIIALAQDQDTSVSASATRTVVAGLIFTIATGMAWLVQLAM